jgi:hypothetical protein
VGSVVERLRVERHVGGQSLAKAAAVAPILRSGPLRLLQTGGCGHDESECTGLGIVN